MNFNYRNHFKNLSLDINHSLEILKKKEEIWFSITFHISCYCFQTNMHHNLWRKKFIQGFQSRTVFPSLFGKIILIYQRILSCIFNVLYPFKILNSFLNWGCTYERPIKFCYAISEARSIIISYFHICFEWISIAFDV